VCPKAGLRISKSDCDRLEDRDPGFPKIGEKRRRDSLERRKSRPKTFQITELPARIRIRTALATVTPAATAAAATGTAVFTRPGLIHRQAAAADLFPACAFDRGGAFGGTAHRDKRESAGLARRMVCHQSYIRRRAELVEKILKIIFGGIERKITYVQFHYV
jgi:hypothetical protein